MRTLIVIALLASQEAHAQELHSLSRIALYSGLAFDLGTTEANLRMGYREANPLLGQNPYQRTGIVIGSAVVVDMSSRWLRRNGHPRLAVALNLFGGCVHFGAGAWNLRR